jgi:hypothetical protein
MLAIVGMHLRFFSSRFVDSAINQKGEIRIVTSY